MNELTSLWAITGANIFSSRPIRNSTGTGKQYTDTTFLISDSTSNNTKNVSKKALPFLSKSCKLGFECVVTVTFVNSSLISQTEKEDNVRVQR